MADSEKTIIEKIKYVASNPDITNLNFNCTHHFYSTKMIKNTFSKEELIYIYNHSYLLDEYMNIKIPCKIKKTQKGNLLVTDVGTFALIDMYDMNIFSDVSWMKLNNINENKINESGEITLNEFIKIISRLECYTTVNSNNYRYYYNCGIIELLSKTFDIYQYYKFLKNIDFDILNRRFKSCNFNFLPSIPLEVMDNDKRIVDIRQDNKYRIKYLYDNFCKFKNNKIVRLYIHAINNNTNIDDDINELKQVLLNPCNNYYFNCVYPYLKNNFSQYLDEEYLIEVYKNNFDKLILLNDEKIIYLAKTIKNNSPLVKLTKDSKEFHLSYEHDYDIYEDKPFGILKKELHMNVFQTIISENIEDYFVYFNELFTKLYKIYYKSYINVSKDQNKHNIYDFMKAIIFNPNNFVSIVRNSDFSVFEIKQLTYTAKCYGKEAEEKFNNFYNNFCLQEKKRVLAFCNYLVSNSDDKEKIINAINSFGISLDNVYKEILNNKFIDSKIKISILSIVDRYFSTKLKVIDIMYILDEMLDRELTLEEILKEKEIDKKTFNKIYSNSLEENPILYEYINNCLSKNKRRGYKKLIKLGYVVLKTNINSLEEFNCKFPDYNFDELLISLEDTELYNKLFKKSSLWVDYNYDKEKKLKYKK